MADGFYTMLLKDELFSPFFLSLYFNISLELWILSTILIMPVHGYISENETSSKVVFYLYPKIGKMHRALHEGWKQRMSELS